MFAHTIKKSSAFTATFVLAYMFAGFLPLAGVMVTLSVYLIARRTLNWGTLRVAGLPYLLAVFVIASTSTLTTSTFPFSAWLTAKDAFFFGAPMLLLVLGLAFLRSESDFTRTFEIAIYGLTLTSIIVYFDFLFGGGLTNVSLETRYSYDLDSKASTLALLLILSVHATLNSLSRNKGAKALLALNFMLIIASLSRVNIAIALISLIFIYSRSKWARGLTITIILLLMVAPLSQITMPEIASAATSKASFFDKVLGSLDEVQISNYSSASDMNENWRGYEAYLGVQEVERAGNIARWIGLGFGSYVIGPFEDKLQNIPYFHNGFVTIYLKAGLLGLITFALFILKLYMQALAARREGRRTGDPRIMRAAVTIAVLTNGILLQTLTTHGVYFSKTTFELFFIGLAISSLQRARRDIVANRKSDARSGA